MSGTLRPHASHGDADELLDHFAAQWEADAQAEDDSLPDISVFIRCCPAGDSFSATVLRLIEIDIEQRWKFRRPVPRITVSEYLDLLPIAISRKARIELVCTEYRARNRWGDCVQLNDLSAQHTDLGAVLVQALQKAAAGIPWPTATVFRDGKPELEARLDRPISAGRQRTRDTSACDVVTTADEHRFVLCRSADTSLSRRQLQAVLLTPQTVLLTNVSNSRSLAIRDAKPLNAGQQRECSLPVFVHLGTTRYLRIARAAKLVRRRIEDISDLPRG